MKVRIVYFMASGKREIVDCPNAVAHEVARCLAHDCRTYDVSMHDHSGNAIQVKPDGRLVVLDSPRKWFIAGHEYTANTTLALA